SVGGTFGGVDQVGVEVLFTQVVLGEEHFDGVFVDAHGDGVQIGDDAAALDGDAAGCQVLGDGEFECGLVGEFVQDLDGAFAKAGVAETYDAVVVLECAGDDFGGRGGAAVEQDGDRVVGFAGGFDSGFGFAQFVGDADGADDGAFVQEEVADADGLV